MAEYTLKLHKKCRTGQIHQETEIVKASQEFIFLAKNMKAHTTAELLVMPAAKMMVRQG